MRVPTKLSWPQLVWLAVSLPAAAGGHCFPRPRAAIGPPAPTTLAMPASDTAEWLTGDSSGRADERRKYWHAVPLAFRWSELLRDRIIRNSIPPPRAARAFALLHAALHDAALEERKAGATREEMRASMCGAAAQVISALLPRDANVVRGRAQSIAALELTSGRNRVSISRAYERGERIGTALVAFMPTAVDGTPITSSAGGGWQVEKPMEPLAGTWRLWLSNDAIAFRPPPPGPSELELAEVAKEVREATESQRQKAQFWNFDVPSILWDDIARKAALERSDCTFDEEDATSLLTTLHLVIADAFVATWNAKYFYLRKRPFMVGAGTQFAPLFTTPLHPSYPSGHSSASAAAAEVLAHFIPGKAADFRALAKEAGDSRVWAGIHYPSDTFEGVALGRKVEESGWREALRRGWISARGNE